MQGSLYHQRDFFKCYSDAQIISKAFWLSRVPFDIWAYKITCFRRAGP